MSVVSEFEAAIQTVLHSPVMTFVDVASSKIFRSYVKRSRGPRFVGLRTEEPVLKKQAHIAPGETRLQFATMRLVESSGVCFGFLFEVPDTCDIQVRSANASIIKRSVKSYSDVALRYQDNYLNVFSAPQGALLLTLNHTHLFMPSIVRETKENKEIASNEA